MSDFFDTPYSMRSDINLLQRKVQELDTELGEQVVRERRRNDVQARRIKALTAVVERLSRHLVEAGVMSPDTLRAELAELEEASKPVSL